ESDADEVLVRQSAEQMGIPYHIRSVYYQDGDGNFQDWARQMRYRFFEEIREETGAVGVATAHQRDDQVETILMKLLRGSGPLSWAGMDYWDGNYLRPLLDITRNKIEEYAHEYEIPYREDASNLESVYARNFLRNEWTSELDERLPGWQQNILRLRDWSQQTGQALEMIMKQLENDRDTWDWVRFCNLSEGLQKALIRYWIKKNHTNEFIVTHGSLGEVSNICQMQSGQYIFIGPGIQAWRDRDLLVFKTEKESRVEAKASLLTKDDLKVGPKVIEFVRFSLSDEYPRAYGKKLYCSLKASDWPITVRPWENGDRFHPLGMKGHQLVSDFLTNRKIPSHRKKEALVVVSFDQKVCAVIFPSSPAISPKGSGEDGPHQASIVSGYPSNSIKQMGYGKQSSPFYQEPGGIAESVRCPDNPVEVLTIEPIL
ncbi:MAG TPA: tRNA lysidine(34) synthetase TilS, partial [Balneolales bacterium]|nr:tRNA lysidine(34) synthetase TilS [Balneolales bacterium]